MNPFRTNPTVSFQVAFQALLDGKLVQRPGQRAIYLGIRDGITEFMSSDYRGRDLGPGVEIRMGLSYDDIVAMDWTVI